MIRWNGHSALSLALAGALTLSLAACGGGAASTPAPTAAPTAAPSAEATPSAAPTAAAETAGDTYGPGISLSIPEEYRELLEVRAVEPGDENRGTFVEVYEKASMEAGKKQHPGEDWGDGWLFSLGVMGEKAFHDLICYDMSGVDVVGDMGDGSYLMYYHPTDVRIAREGDITDGDMQQWTALNEWASTVAASVRQEKGYAPYTRTNTQLDMSLNQVLYQPDCVYTLSSLDYGVDLKPREGVDSTAYLEQLTDGLTVELLENGEAPDGQYTVLNLPEQDIRYDFFQSDGNLVREVSGEMESFYRLTYADGSTVAGDVLRDWCAALAAV